MGQWLCRKLTESLQPLKLHVSNESHKHASHAAMKAGGGGSGETHFEYAPTPWQRSATCLGADASATSATERFGTLLLTWHVCPALYGCSTRGQHLTSAAYLTRCLGCPSRPDSRHDGTVDFMCLALEQLQLSAVTSAAMSIPTLILSESAAVLRLYLRLSKAKRRSLDIEWSTAS